MIDTATVERYMRDANPIRGLDEVDPDELAFAVAVVHTRTAAAMQAPTQHRAPPTGTIRPRRRLRSAWAIAAAFILVTAAIGVVALALRDEHAPVADELPVEVESLQWTRVAHDGALFGASGDEPGAVAIHRVMEGGPGIMAVGEHNGNAAIWTSVDGYTWARVPHDETVFGGVYNARMVGITEGGPGYVAVGAGGVGSNVWTSSDGLTWSRVELHEGSPSGGLMDVAAAGPGLIAIGSESADDAVWTSVDGLTWELVDKSHYFDGHDVWTDVIVGGPGVVAVASGWESGGAYTSTDGVTWSQHILPHDPALTEQATVEIVTMGGVAVGGPGLVAVGTEGLGTPADEKRLVAAVWTSIDGSVWTRVPHDDEVFGDAGMTSIAAGPTGLVAVGATHEDLGSDEELHASMAWTSQDGITWSRVPVDHTVFLSGLGYEIWDGMSDIVAAGPGFVAVGSIETRIPGTDNPTLSNRIGAIWIAEINE